MTPYNRELEFVESTGSQFVDTGVVLSDNFEYFEAEFEEIESAHKGFLLGNGWDHSSICLAVVDSNFYMSNCSGEYAIHNGTCTSKWRLYVDKDCVRLTNLDEGSVFNYPMKFNRNPSSTVRIFGTGVGSFSSSFRFYSVKVVDGGVVTLDLVPVLDKNNTPCIYNRANGELYYNQTDVPLVAGEKNYSSKRLTGRAMSTRFTPLGLAGNSITAKDYVQEGLVAHFDGFENVGHLLHSNDAKIWINLADFSNSARVYRSASWDKDGLIVDGSNIAASLNNIDAMTFEMVFEPYNAKVGNSLYQILLFHYGGMRNTEGIVLICAPVSDTSKFSVNDAYGHGANASITKSIFESRLAVQITTLKTRLINMNMCFVNGERCTVGTTSFTDGVGGNAVNRSRIGGQGVDLRTVHGKIFSLRLYSRQLTIDEIAHNYAIDKERFGL